MNIYIEGKRSDMSDESAQRTKRALNVLKDIGFDIKLGFSVPEDDKYVMYLPCEEVRFEWEYRPQKVSQHIGELLEIIETR